MTAIATFPAGAPIDCGLRCPRCQYNLTGLPEPRCPECGTVFDWDAVRQAAERRRLTIAFERARGWRRVPAFFVTWATVLFAPWVFARQAVRCLGAVPAREFGWLCLLSPWLARALWLELPYAAGWFAAALACILGQAAWLALVDVGGTGRFLRRWYFWVLIGCYTSAVMPTEVWLGPPKLEVADLQELRYGIRESPLGLLESYHATPVGTAIINAQFVLWLAGLACVYVARMRSGRCSWLLTLLLLPLMLAGEVVLYATFTTHVGQEVASYLRGPAIFGPPPAGLVGHFCTG